ncbi:unnamed protein product [Allacma fusca]|uniref:Uncharacterized protein n=1 Tax=Allacma fusca TaxID=39272 RepID=A0A8J2PUE5_9HEXA|nr:unnamed protein product [Allacma fusca]
MLLLLVLPEDLSVCHSRISSHSYSLSAQRKIVTGSVKKVRTGAGCIEVAAAAGAVGSGVQASLMKAHAVDDMQPTIPQIEDQHNGAMKALADTVANAVIDASAAVFKRSGIASGVIKSTYSKSHDNATATEVPSGESAHDLNNTRPQKFLGNTKQSCR